MGCGSSGANVGFAVFLGAQYEAYLSVELWWYFYAQLLGGCWVLVAPRATQDVPEPVCLGVQTVENYAILHQELCWLLADCKQIGLFIFMFLKKGRKKSRIAVM